MSMTAKNDTPTAEAEMTMRIAELEAERAQLEADNAAAPGWGAAVGARAERIAEITGRLTYLRRFAPLAAPTAPRAPAAVPEEREKAARDEYARWGTGCDTRRTAATRSWVCRKDDQGVWRETTAHASEMEAANAMHEQALNAAFRTLAAAPAAPPADGGTEGEGEKDWRDDPSADERWNAGLDFGMVQLCAVLGVDPKSIMWDGATETLDGDVCSAIGRVMEAWGGEDWQDLAGGVETTNDDAFINTALSPRTPAGAPEDVLGYATRLAQSLSDKYFPNPDWRPLPDLYGVLTQIDNMTTGLARTPAGAAGDLCPLPGRYDRGECCGNDPCSLAARPAAPAPTPSSESTLSPAQVAPRDGGRYSGLTWDKPIELPAEAGRGLAGQIMDAAWPEFGGNNLPGEFWQAFDLAIRFTLEATTPASAGEGELRDRVKNLIRGFMFAEASIQSLPFLEQDGPRTQAIEVAADCIFEVLATRPTDPGGARGWLDISSAPKDGTFVLCVIAGYRPGIYAWQNLNGEYAWRNEPEQYADPAHFEAYWSDTVYDPTHWQPIPEPPAASTASSDAGGAE